MSATEGAAMARSMAVDVTTLENVNGEEGVDEPYVMVGYVVVDASTISLDLDAVLPQPGKTLIDASRVSFTWVHVGRGDPVPDEVAEGTQAAIPEAYGHVSATLAPLTFRPPGGGAKVVVPGLLLVYLGLAERDSSSEDFVKSVQTKSAPVIERFVREYLEGITVGVLASPDPNDPALTFTSPGYGGALSARLRNDFTTTVKPKIQAEVRKITLAEVISDVLAHFPLALDADEDLHSTLWVIPSDECPVSGLTGSGTLVQHTIKDYVGDKSWNYTLWGTYGWSTSGEGRLDVSHTKVGESRFGRPLRRILETEEGDCGHRGDTFVLERRTTDETFAIRVPAKVDESTYGLTVNGLTITKNGLADHSLSGVFVVPGPATWTDLASSTETWPTKIVSMDQEVACAWHIDPSETDIDGGFVLHVHRLPADDLDARPGMALQVTLTQRDGNSSRDVESQTIRFQPMRIHNPVLECIFAHANVMMQQKIVFDLERPPWMDPPAHGPDGPWPTSGGWLYQLSDHDLRDAVLARAVSRGDGLEGPGLARRRQALQRLGLSADDAARVARIHP